MPFVLFSKYTRTGASSRYRSFQYLAELEAAGLRLTVSPLFDDDYLAHKYAHGRARLGDVLRAFVWRLWMVLTVPRGTVVFIEYELLPWFPAVFEHWLAWRKCRIVADYDDALFHQYDSHPSSCVRLLLGRKIASVMRLADTVVVGNAYLADYARRAGASRIELIPTVVDLSRYSSVASEEASTESTAPVVGWIGSPSTTAYLSLVEPALALACRESSATVHLIGASAVDLPKVPHKLIDWNESTEVFELQRLSIGIMPLPDSPWARGKCGLKLIQYMACGLPVVASPVGVNTSLVEHGVNGFLASTPDEWRTALLTLLKDADLRRRMGAAGRAKVEREYSLQVTAPRMLRLLQNLNDGQPDR